MDGIAYSEPVVTFSDGRVVDNFFTYTIDRIGNTCSGIIHTFGIDVQVPEVVYLNEDLSGELDSHPLSDDGNFTEEDLARYEQLYVKVRDMVQKDVLSDEEKTELEEYEKLLKALITPGLSDSYKKIGAAFFEWARANGVDSF